MFTYENKILNVIMHTCPYGPGFVRIENTTITPEDNEELHRAQVFQMDISNSSLDFSTMMIRIFSQDV